MILVSHPPQIVWHLSYYSEVNKVHEWKDIIHQNPILKACVSFISSCVSEFVVWILFTIPSHKNQNRWFNSSEEFKTDVTDSVRLFSSHLSFSAWFPTDKFNGLRNRINLRTRAKFYLSIDFSQIVYLTNNLIIGGWKKVPILTLGHRALSVTCQELFVSWRNKW